MNVVLHVSALPTHLHQAELVSFTSNSMLLLQANA